MRDPKRIERIAALLAEAWCLVPDYRLTQLLMVVSEKAHDNTALWHIEDDYMEAKLRAFIEKAKKPN